MISSTTRSKRWCECAELIQKCGTLIPQDAKKHAQQYTLRPINSHLYLVHVKHSMALYNVQKVSARHRAGQKAREGDAGLTCGGA